MCAKTFESDRRNSQRHKLIKRLQQFKGVNIVDLASRQSLEDTQQTLELSSGHKHGSTAHDDSLPYSRQSGDVSPLLPKRGVEQRSSELLVLGREVG